MTISNITNTGQYGGARAAGQILQFDSEGGFSGNLRVGDILQGKVTRHFDGSRYAVDFGGSEKVVDSAIPLSRGELIHGRVIGLGDKVQLQRIHPEREQALREENSSEKRSGNQAILQKLCTQYRAKLTTEATAQVLSLMRGYSAPAQVALSSLIIHKLGFQVEPVLVRSVNMALAGSRHMSDALTEKIAPVLISDTEPGQRFDLQQFRDFASTLAALSEPRPPQMPVEAVKEEAGSREDGAMGGVDIGNDGGGAKQNGERGYDEEQLGRWIINAQTAGSVSHRLARIPVWFGESLVEVDVALFSQRDATVRNERVRFRKIVLSLKTDSLGHVEVSVFVTDRRLRLHFVAESEQASNELATHYADIRSALEMSDWVIEEVSYKTAQSVPDGLMMSVVEHYIVDDSLNRLM